MTSRVPGKETSDEPRFHRFHTSGDTCTATFTYEGREKRLKPTNPNGLSVLGQESRRVCTVFVVPSSQKGRPSSFVYWKGVSASVSWIIEGTKAKQLLKSFHRKHLGRERSSVILDDYTHGLVARVILRHVASSSSAYPSVTVICGAVEERNLHRADGGN